MRETRKSLKAENTQLAAQLAVHNHNTRASLHDMIRMTRERNEYLVKELAKVTAERDALKAKYEPMKEAA